MEMEWERLVAQVEGFQWDAGNDMKSVLKHRVSCQEAEDIFRNRPLLLRDDEEYGQKEPRCRALGKTDKGRRLHLAFTIRGKLIRVISVRDMNRKERQVYGV